MNKQGSLVFVQVCVCVCKAIVCMCVGSTCVKMSVCLHVGLFYGKAFPCCLSLVCAGAILSCSRDCNEQLAVHQALIRTWFPREIARASVCV